VHFQPATRDLLIGAIVVLWVGAGLLRSYLQISNKARAAVTEQIRNQHGEPTTVKVSSGRPRLFGLRLRVDNPLLGTFDVGSGEAKQAQRKLQSIQGRIAPVKFNPADPQSVQEAIRQFDRDVDAKLGPYPEDKTIAETSKRLKRDFRQTVEEQVGKFARSAARQK
jgi:hypothetical protein